MCTNNFFIFSDLSLQIAGVRTSRALLIKDDYAAEPGGCDVMLERSEQALLQSAVGLGNEFVELVSLYVHWNRHVSYAPGSVAQHARLETGDGGLHEDDKMTMYHNCRKFCSMLILDKKIPGLFDTIVLVKQNTALVL